MAQGFIRLLQNECMKVRIQNTQRLWQRYLHLDFQHRIAFLGHFVRQVSTRSLLYKESALVNWFQWTPWVSMGLLSLAKLMKIRLSVHGLGVFFSFCFPTQATWSPKLRSQFSYPKMSLGDFVCVFFSTMYLRQMGGKI